MDRQTNVPDSKTHAEINEETEGSILNAKPPDVEHAVGETQTTHADAEEASRSMKADVEEAHSLVDADVGEMNSLYSGVNDTNGISDNADAGRKRVSMENGGPTVFVDYSEPVQDQTPQTKSDDLAQHHDDTEDDRYEHIREVAATGNGLKLERLLGEWDEKGWLRDWRNEDNLTLYVDAVTDGYLDVINALLAFDLPLGDALLRAIDVEFDDAIKAICNYIQKWEDVREFTLKGTCDNDDFHPSITPLILAAQRNNFDVVKLLIDLGAKIEEPSMSFGGDVTLTQAISTLHIYRALSQPACILATQTDIFGHAFELSAKLKTLSRMWEDFGAEYEEMARGVEVFAGEMLGQSASTEEILALFRYHNTDKYRDSEGKQHPLAKLFEAIDYQQKEFIAHPHSQKAIIVQFYRNLLDWNERGVLYQIFLTCLVLFGYPIICLLYKFLPFRSVVNFARQPYVMMLMKAGSGFTFLAFITAVTVLDKRRYPGTVETLNVLILLWVLGLVWLHLKIIRKHGLRKYTSDSMNIHEAIIAILCISVVCLYWVGDTEVSQGAEVNGAKLLDVQNLLTSTKNGFAGKLNDTTIESLSGVLEKALSSCRFRDTTDATSGSEKPLGASLPDSLRATVENNQYDPTVVAGALFGVTVTVSVLRMLNLFLMSDAVGPLRISLGGMVSDIVKFCCIFVVIWFAFAIGLSQNFYSAGRSATRACLAEGSEPDDCQDPVGFSTFFASVRDLYWALYGQTGKNILRLPGKQLVAETVGTFLFVGYIIIAVLVLLNALIGMLSNTYNLTEEHADREWKFHRAAVWAAYLRPVETLPPPFNLIPSVTRLYRCLVTIIRITCGCAEKGRVYLKVVHSESERDDYKRVLKLVSSRYIQANLSSESQSSEGVRPRDLQTLRNDILAFKYGVEDRLSKLTKTLDTSRDKTSRIHRKVEDLEPVKARTSGLVKESAMLTDHLASLRQEADDVHMKQEAELQYAKRHANTLKWRIGMLKFRIVRLKNEHAAEIELRLAHIDELQNKIVGLEADKTALSAAIERGRGQIAELEDSLLRSKLDNQTLSEDVKNKAAELENLKEIVRGLETEKEALSTELEEKVREVDELQGIVSDLKEDNVVLSETLRRMGRDPTQRPKTADQDIDHVGFVRKTVQNFENMK